MPFKSEKQRAWMYANDPSMAKKFEKHTPKDTQLPTKVTKGKNMAKMPSIKRYKDLSAPELKEHMDQEKKVLKKKASNAKKRKKKSR